MLDALVEYRSILCGAKTHVHSDHKNVTHLNTTHAGARAQHHLPLLEELGCTVFHVPEDNMN